jgi:hypothetical protein
MSSDIGQLACALCGGAIDIKEPFFRASGTFLPADDPLERYANAPLHWGCYAGWGERARFARHHVDAWVKANRRNPFWWLVFLDERCYVSVNPERPIEEVSVRLSAIGSDIRVPLAKWRAWLDDPMGLTPHLQPLERDALLPLLPILRTRFPDDHAIVHAIDPAEKRPRAERARAC